MAEPVYILSAEAATALGSTAEATWQGVMAGACGIGPTRRFPHGKYGTDVAAELPPEVCDHLRDAADGGTWTAALAQMVGRSALQRAGIDPSAGRVGFVLATVKGCIEQLDAAVQGRAAPAIDLLPLDRLAARVRDRLGLRGPWAAVSVACASGLGGVIHAARWIQRGEVDVALVVGVEVLAHYMFAGFTSVKAVSSRPCRPYDADRDGLSLGEGAGALVLSRQPGRQGGAVRIAGFSTSNDAEHVVSPSATGRGLVLALRRAVERAGLEPSQIDAINGHGTATIKNDQMEADAFAAVFGDHRPWTTSFKGSIGHTLGAAGAVETVLCAMALEQGVVPASHGFARAGVTPCPNVATDHVALPARRNMVTVKAGFGGMNAAMVLRWEGG